MSPPLSTTGLTGASTSVRSVKKNFNSLGRAVVLRPAGEDAQGGGEGVRLARLAVFAAEESAVAAGKGHGRRGHGTR